MAGDQDGNLSLDAEFMAQGYGAVRIAVKHLTVTVGKLDMASELLQLIVDEDKLTELVALRG